MNTLRLTIPVPYRTMAVRKGGRVPRETLCRAPLAVEIPVVAPDDMLLAVQCRGCDSEIDLSRDYFGYGGALYCEARDSTMDDGLLRVERGLEELSSGAKFLGSIRNPFLRCGPVTVDWQEFDGARRAEEMGFRSVVSDDRERVFANATRLASDLLVCEDGRVLRRSIGPQVVVKPEGIVLLTTDFEPRLPGVHQTFGAARLDQARDWAASEVPAFAGGFFGDLRIIESSLLPDHDAFHVALHICNPVYGPWAAKAAAGRGPGAELAAARVADAAGQLRGLDGAEVVADPERNRWPLGNRPLRPEEIVEAVDAVRGFFEGSAGEVRIDRKDVLDRSCAEKFARSLFGTLARWDLYERDRLPGPVPPPEIPMIEGPRP